MIGLINCNGLLVSREKAISECAPVRIVFHTPITDESLRSLAAFAYCIANGENEMKQTAEDITPKEEL